MGNVLGVDWHGVFVPSQGLLEVVVRGTITYWVLFGILRFFLTRQAGAIGIADLLVVVLIADAAQNAMGSDYSSVTEGVVLVLTIVFWNWFIDWLGFRVPALRRLNRAEPLLLVEDGRMRRDVMNRALITPEELMSQLRQQGVADLKEARWVYLEGDGRVSVIKRDGDEQQGESGQDRQRLGA
ncbi:MAG TPA: YetF domain-containing protein [Beijerinckiaceae bacterium]|jgi:uncharacterized membrane protein YcaP (DUF421 family)